MDGFDLDEESPSSPLYPYKLLFDALSLIPVSHYVLAFTVISITFLYKFLEIHIIGDAFNGFRGSAVNLTYNSDSHIYRRVVSKCRILHGRYLTTPWLSSPHIQTCFLNFFGRPPVFNYRRQLFHISDGGTIALDWLTKYDVSGGPMQTNREILKDDATPIVVVIPGLTSDSASPYLKHLAHGVAKHGWNVVICNHRGLGGVSITSDCFYNAGWTVDTKIVVNYLHREYPKAPLFAIGTSIGANILVKYLGEEGEKIPIAGAVAICSPWDLLIGDRFICRKLAQKFYDRALTIGLQGYAQLHEPLYSRLANFEGIKKSRSIRDFDNFATCLVGKFETVDTYYRRCSSSTYVTSVSVPLLCISALDDPVCTREAIPWDECRANKNIVLATTQHGGHLAFFEGLTGASLWWVRAANEFLHVLHSGPCMHVQKKNPARQSSLESSIDQGPYVNIAVDGMLSALGTDSSGSNMMETIPESQETFRTKTNESISEIQHDENLKETNDIQTSGQITTIEDTKPINVTSYARKRLSQFSRQQGVSMWLLAYIAVASSYPLVSSILQMLFKRKRRIALPVHL